MQIQCEKCSQQIEYEDSAPKFCSECGAALTGSQVVNSSTIRDDATVAAQLPAHNADSDIDSLAATTPPTGGTRPISAAHAEKFNLSTVGPYRLLGKLGQGGMGTVYEAVHMDTGQHVALKLLSANVGGTDDMVQRFKRESEIAASINHPRSTFVYESGEHDGQLYITMELMSGGTLSDVIDKEGPLPVARAVDYVLDIIDGLMVAHDAGIVHRDLKPSNSFIDSDGRIKVGDFGLAKSFLADSSLTQTGTFMGTPQYAAPEQVRNEDIDERTDIYALGGTLFYLLSGRAPFVGNAAQVITSIATDVPSRVSEFAKNVPKPLVNLIAQTLEKDPNRRPFNLNVVRDVLLPYSTRGAMAADPGRRMAAYFVDVLVFTFLAFCVSTIFSPILVIVSGILQIELRPQALGFAISFPVAIGYFSLLESRFGRTFGKWLFGMRVVTGQSESPGFLNSLLRALMAPGIWMIVSNIISYIFVDSTNMSSWTDIFTFTFKSQSISILSWVAVVPLIATARKENGYHCLHGILSGTKVVRLAGDLESRLLDHCGVTVPAKVASATPIGGFEVLGLFKSSQSGESAYLARDSKLNRPIWVFDGFDEQPLDEQRRHLSRPSRLRVISQSEQQGKYWYATESVPGLPLKDACNHSSSDWQSVCPLIRDAAYELMQSQEHDLLPDELSPSQIWLDHTGRVRVLDHTLIENQKNVKAVTSSDTTDSQETLSTVIESFMKTNDHPVELIRVQNELHKRRNEPEKYHWLVNRLNDMMEHPSSWNLVDRMGMLAISVGMEYALVVSSVFLAGFLLAQTNLTTITQYGLNLAAGCAAIGIMAFATHGGLAIRLSGVSVRRSRDKSEASRLRSALRAIIGWLPWTALLAMTMYVIFHAQQQPADSTFEMDMSIKPIDPVYGLSVFACFVVFGLGLLVTIFNPPRGLQDFAAGTRLMRK